MAVREFTYKGIPESKLVGLSLDDFKKIVPSRIKRSLERGPTPSQKRFMEKVKRVKAKGITKPLRTHSRNIMIVPEMVGLTIMIYSGKEFVPVEMTAEKLGHYLGEFTLTRKKITHNAPGIGATRSSKFVPLK